jgi:hypothetical protein
MHRATELLLKPVHRRQHVCDSLACSIFRDRLQPAAESHEEEGGEARQPSLSLFGLMKEGHLSRSAAAMLFYQVCGESLERTSHGMHHATVQHRRCSSIHVTSGGQKEPWLLLGCGAEGSHVGGYSTFDHTCAMACCFCNTLNLTLAYSLLLPPLLLLLLQ